jgi:hypothetical protein
VVINLKGIHRRAGVQKLVSPPEPIVPQHLVRTVEERVGRNGTIEEATPFII